MAGIQARYGAKQMTDIIPIPLQMKYKEDGKPIESGTDILAGEYNIDQGMTFDFILENRNSNLVAEIELDTINFNSSITGPQIIQPLKSVKMTYTINAKTENDLDNFNKPEKLPSSSDSLNFKVKWSIASPVGSGWSN